jgi:hypothetical protein
VVAAAVGVVAVGGVGVGLVEVRVVGVVTGVGAVAGVRGRRTGPHRPDGAADTQPRQQHEHQHAGEGGQPERDRHERTTS